MANYELPQTKCARCYKTVTWWVIRTEADGSMLGICAYCMRNEKGVSPQDASVLGTWARVTMKQIGDSDYAH